MSAPTFTSALVGGVGLLERATAYTLGSLLQVREDDLDRQTPCSEWRLRQLLHHMNDSLAALHEAAETSTIDLGPLPGGSDLEHIVDSLRDRACRLLGAWTRGRQDVVGIADAHLSSPLVAAAGALEIAMHGWDVSMACGQYRDIPPELAAELHELAVLLITPRDRPVRFAAPLPTTPDAGPGQRLLAWVGRDPGAHPVVATPT